MARNDMHGLKNHKNEENEVENEEQDVTLRSRFLAIRDKLKLGPHYKMERFSVIFGVSLFFLLLFVTLSFIHHRSTVKSLASTQALITEDFNFSLSNQKMYVEGVYGDKNKTDVMVLLRMGDPNGMSTNAKNYELYITGESDTLSYKPKTSLAFFGSTGYGIIRFQSKTPLPKEIMNITIRAKSELSARDGSGSSGEKGDADGSFAKYDQGRLYVNPGADGVKTLKHFHTGENDPSKLYVSLVANAKDKEIKKKIDDQTKELGQMLNRADEYRNRLVSSGYEPPNEPWFIEGDYVDDDGVFRPAKDVLRAHKFDYYTKSIRDGYITQVMSGLSEFDDYMKKHEESASALDEDESHKEDVEPIELLKHEDGKELDLDTVSEGTSPSVQVAAKNAVESLQDVWRSYINTKAKLQRDSMHDLLVLDADVLSQPVGFSENNTKGAVIFY